MNAAAREVLGVDEDATEEEILKAFRKKTLEHHPNKGGTHEGFLAIQSARDYLLGRASEFFNAREEESAPKPQTAKAETKPRKAKSEKRKREKQKKQLPKKPTNADEWMAAKVEFPKAFTVNEDGDLVVPPYKAGESETVIIHTEKAPATKEHMLQFFAQRNEALKTPEEEFAVAKRELQTTYMQYKREEASIDDLLEANRKVAESEAKLNSIVKYPRDFVILKGLATNDLNFDWYRRAKIAVPVGTAMYSVFPWQPFWTAAPDTIDLEGILEETEEENNAALAGGAKPKRDLTAQQRAIIANIRRRKAGGF